jgi:hypothetical protein
LLLNLGELDEPIRKAFAAFGYNPDNPFHWRNLIWHFAHAHFSPPPKKGAPTKWDDGRWCQLLSDFGEVKASSRHNASDNEVCINIKKKFAILAQIRNRFAVQIREWAITQPGVSSSLNPGQIALTWALEYH